LRSGAGTGEYRVWLTLNIIPWSELSVEKYLETGIDGEPCHKCDEHTDRYRPHRFPDNFPCAMPRTHHGLKSRDGYIENREKNRKNNQKVDDVLRQSD
jgi:hypothetical protein